MSADVTTIRAEVVEAALAGTPLTAADVTALAVAPDILALGALADDVRRARHHATTTFVRVHALDLAAAGSWTPPPVEAREVRLEGSLPAVPGDDAHTPQALVRRARALAGDLPLHGFVLGDLIAAGGTALLAELRAAGLDGVALVEPGADAAAAVTAARAAGLTVQVVGTVLAPVDRAAWLLEVRALQQAVGGLVAVAPLARVADPTTPTTGFDDVRHVALARLALETIAHVQVDWRWHGPKLAQVALTVGANDIDGVAADDDLSRGPRRAPLEEIRRNIAAAGQTPVERDARFTALA